MAPTALAAAVDIKLQTPRAVVELATVYGGLELGLGVALISLSRSDKRVKTALFIAFCTLLGVAVVRGVGMLIHGSDTTLLALLAPEAMGAAACGWAWRTSRADG